MHKDTSDALLDGDGNNLATFKEAFVITTSNNYGGAYHNVALIPSTLSMTSKAFNVNVNTPDIYVSGSAALTVYKVKA